ncbi:MAG: hypothetical protein A3H02_01830 [Candidatus Niyogibacteria bacterium RIFCSPLOWO2_12_FULL_41_13]|uniref:Uncharacterized protein n=1 Tax=Candidatus Niyogibacteria bacterium RIFCSPLOWO2_12_FULL_41_13 TaxID=1801726 RepID=A0A1G2F3J2_9BACT|nr:MAG: hypothetical protein A3H02_01830 [Candidatus Niyogibacteria bacterium RIFCSPLOWO2_12_FULL_41_13]
MIAITIPKNLIKDDLVIIPRKDYEDFLRLQKVMPLIELTPSQKRDLEQSRKEFSRGEYITLRQLENELGIASKKAR